MLFYRMVIIIYNVSPENDQSSKHGIMAITMMQKEIKGFSNRLWLKSIDEEVLFSILRQYVFLLFFLWKLSSWSFTVQAEVC